MKMDIYTFSEAEVLEILEDNMRKRNIQLLGPIFFRKDKETQEIVASAAIK